MRVINNINGNHNNSIKNILTFANEMILVSPFLMENFEEFIYDISEIGIEKVTLVTTLKDDTTDLFKKANAFYSFCVACMVNKVCFEIRIENKLHGKVYIALKNNVPLTGIITSANLTENGLYHSHEWGIEIDDSNELQKIINDIFTQSSSPLSKDEIDNIIRTIDDYLKVNKPKPKPEPKPSLKVNKLIKERIPVDPIENNIRYFLKPVGSSEEPFDINERPLNRNIEELHFSKRRPASVRPGDILICYGVGSTKLLGYFKVLTEPKLVRSEESRWPWGVDAQNLIPDYSDNWTKYNNTIASIQASYHKDRAITYVGGKSLGTLNFGADKIQLDADFATHVIDIIRKSISI